MDYSEIIKRLNLLEHPEGGFFRQTFKSDRLVKAISVRSAFTHIYYLLPSGTYSRFHRVAQDEIWNLYEGEGVKLFIFDADTNKFSE
jgi:predicted cupin superfamily sugar epimerase